MAFKTLVGIDTSKADLEAASIDETSEARQKNFLNTTSGHKLLLEWLQGQPGCLVTLEATGTYHQHATKALQDSGLHVSVINPAQISFFMKSHYRRNKTDKADALWLAMYGREREPTATITASPVMKSLTRELQALKEDLGRLRNRLKAASSGLVHPEVLASLQLPYRSTRSGTTLPGREAGKRSETAITRRAGAAHQHSRNWCENRVAVHR